MLIRLVSLPRRDKSIHLKDRYGVYEDYSMWSGAGWEDRRIKAITRL
jgi:hypothetical protein